MVSTKSRVPNIGGAAPLSKRVEYLLRALNDEWKGSIKGNRKAVDRRALHLLVKRFKALERVIRDKRIPLFSRSDAGQVEDNLEVLRLYRGVNSALRRYTARPSILPDYMTDLDPRSRGWQFNWGRARKSSQPFIEVGLALDIVEIASVGQISALKECEQCHKWLFARFPHQRFCSGGKCQQEFHKFNEADKKRRRDWARANYQSRKELELGSRKAAQRKGGKRK